MIECPYCKTEQDDPDDLYGDDESCEVECERGFVVTASVSINYSTHCGKGRHKPYSGDRERPDLSAFGDRVWCEHCDEIVDRSDCEAPQ